GHPDVHQHHVRAQLTAHPYRLAAVARGAEHGEVRLRVQQRGEPGPHHLVVVGDDDADGHWLILSGGAPVMASGALAGSSASTRKPPPPASPVCRDPPTAAARSRMPSRPWPA